MTKPKLIEGLSNSLRVAFSVIGALIVLSSAGVSSEDEKKDRKEIACQLVGDEFDDRIADISRWLAQSETIAENDDGYTFRFPGSEEWAERLTDFVRSERRCCTFFTFTLTFEPGSGPISLYIGGSAEIKKYVESILE